MGIIYLSVRKAVWRDADSLRVVITDSDSYSYATIRLCKSLMYCTTWAVLSPKAGIHWKVENGSVSLIFAVSMSPRDDCLLEGFLSKFTSTKLLNRSLYQVQPRLAAFMPQRYEIIIIQRSNFSILNIILMKNRVTCKSVWMRN